MATWFRKNKQLVSTLLLWDNLYQEVLQNNFFHYDDLIINRHGNLFEKKTKKIGLYNNIVGQYRCGGFVGYFFVKLVWLLIWKTKQLVRALLLWDNKYCEVLQDTFFVHVGLIINHHDNLFEKKKKIGQCNNIVGKYIWGGLVEYFFCQVGLIINHYGNLVQKKNKETIGQCINIVWHYI